MFICHSDVDLLLLQMASYPLLIPRNAEDFFASIIHPIVGFATFIEDLGATLKELGGEGSDEDEILKTAIISKNS